MEKAAEELDNKFQVTEKKLDNMSWKVEQLTKLDSAAGDNSLSAAQLLTSVQEIRQEFTGLVQEVEQLKTEQQTAMNNIMQELQTAMSSAEQLQSKLNMPDKDN